MVVVVCHGMIFATALARQYRTAFRLTNRSAPIRCPAVSYRVVNGIDNLEAIAAKRYLQVTWLTGDVLRPNRFQFTYLE